MSTVGARGCCAVLCAHDIPNPFPHALLQREDARLPLSVLSPFGQVYRDSTVLPRSRPSAAKRAAFALELSSAVDVRSDPTGMALSPFGIVRQHVLFPRAAPRTPAASAPAAPRLLRPRIGAGACLSHDAFLDSRRRSSSRAGSLLCPSAPPLLPSDLARISRHSAMLSRRCTSDAAAELRSVPLLSERRGRRGGRRRA